MLPEARPYWFDADLFRRNLRLRGVGRNSLSATPRVSITKADLIGVRQLLDEDLDTVCAHLTAVPRSISRCTTTAHAARQGGVPGRRGRRTLDPGLSHATWYQMFGYSTGDPGRQTC